MTTLEQYRGLCALHIQELGIEPQAFFLVEAPEHGSVLVFLEATDSKNLAKILRNFTPISVALVVKAVGPELYAAVETVARLEGWRAVVPMVNPDA